MELKRDVIKYIRDRAKSGYSKDTECYVCGTTKDLQFHHYNTLTLLLEKWLDKHKEYPEHNVLDWRDQFIAEHQVELYDETVTLCSFDHNEKLHGIYGKKPSLHTAKKQARWCQKQREKRLNA